MKEKVQLFIDKIRSAQSIAIMGHKNPDGDSLCCVLALAKLIEANFGKRATCLYDGNIPDALDNVPYRHWMHFFERVDMSQPFDLAIIVDYGADKNIGGPRPIIDNARFVVEIDHHKNDNPIATLCIDDDTAAAAGVVVYNIMQTAGWRYDINVANLLACAILTDTGNFKFARDGGVLRIMAEFVDRGVCIRDLLDSMNNKPQKAVLVEARAAASAEFLYHKRLALATIENKDYRNMDGRGETVLGLLGQIKGVDFVVLLKQQKPDRTGVSIRSRGPAIDHIAAALGGGGHERAAGAIVDDTLENVRARVVQLFGEMMS